MAKEAVGIIFVALPIEATFNSLESPIFVKKLY